MAPTNQNRLAASAHSPIFPAWARVDGPLNDVGESAYLAGAALAILTVRLRSDAAFAGVWLRRLALKAAAASARIALRGDDETMLRDAFYLRQPGADPGPSGNFLTAWHRLDSSTPLADKNILAVAADLGLRDDGALRTAIAAAQDLTRSDRAAPFAAAVAATSVLAQRPDAESWALWLADGVLAARLKWPRPLPLLAGALQHASMRVDTRGRRPHPNDAGWTLSCVLAYGHAAAQACDLFADLERRAETLQRIAPRLRAKGAADVIAKLLDEDAIVPSGRAGGMGDRALRRLCDRLVVLGGIRELTGRSTFRLYGL